MFSLYIIISHNKLLRKSHSINDEILINSFLSIVESGGGLVSGISPYLCLFPSKYNYSVVKFLKCLQELHKVLNDNSDLIGFSLIVDNFLPINEFEYNENLHKLTLSTNVINSVWFSSSSYSSISDKFKGVVNRGLVMAEKSFFITKFSNSEPHTNIIDSDFQNELKINNAKVVKLKTEMNISIYENLVFWGKNSGYSKSFYIDFGPSCDSYLTFIDYLISLKDIFDPTKDLDSDDRILWGSYLDLYSKFSNRNYDCFILDDALIHFNKLILLWVKSFAKKKSVMFLVSISFEDESIALLWQLISLIPGVKVVLFHNEISADKISFKVKSELSLESWIGCSVHEYLKGKSDESIMILYTILLFHGSILVKDLLSIFDNLGYSILVLKEELDCFKRDGLLIGQNNLYPGSSKIISSIDTISKIKNINLYHWKNIFLKSFLELKYDKIFSYSYIFSLIGLNSDFKSESVSILYNFIQKILDLGREARLSTDILNMKSDNKLLENILEYKKVRESRLKGVITEVRTRENSLNENMYESSLEFLDLLNIWSTKREGDLRNRSKELYYIYQTKSEPYNESRAKTIFALALLSTGSIGEAVDYFELNCSFCKNISDTYSYIRNGCFLAMALFVKGDISGVLRISEELLNHSWIFFKTRWLLYLKFIRARALNELGDYNKSLELLDSGIVLSKNFNYSEIETVFSNWRGRTLFYLNREGEAREVLLGLNKSSESLFFMAEIEYFSGNFSKGLEYIIKADIKNDDIILFDEELKWRDGFFMVEEFFDRSRTTSVLKSEIDNLRCLLEILNGNLEVFEEYKKIVLNISNNSIGLFDYKYLYYLYVAMVYKNDDQAINRENILNKIVRQIQHRASILAEHNQKHLYLNNFINSHILSDVKK